MNNAASPPPRRHTRNPSSVRSEPNTNNTGIHTAPNELHIATHHAAPRRWMRTCDRIDTTSGATVARNNVNSPVVTPCSMPNTLNPTNRTSHLSHLSRDRTWMAFSIQSKTISIAVNHVYLSAPWDQSCTPNAAGTASPARCREASNLEPTRTTAFRWTVTITESALKHRPSKSVLIRRTGGNRTETKQWCTVYQRSKHSTA